MGVALVNDVVKEQVAFLFEEFHGEDVIALTRRSFVQLFVRCSVSVAVPILASNSSRTFCIDAKSSSIV